MKRRYAWFGALLLAAPLVGCGASVGPPLEARCSPAVAHGPGKAPAIEGCWSPTGAEDQSPSIQVSKHGVLFVARAKGGMLRSDDHGRTWSELPVPDLANGDSHAGGLHGYVHIDSRTDRVYYLTSLGASSCGGLAGAVLSWSDDEGQSWTGNTVSCDTWDWGKVVTGPAPAGNAYPSAIYFLGTGVHLAGGVRYVSRSLDGGATWTRMERPSSVTVQGGGGVAAPDGTIYYDYPENDYLDPERKDNTLYPYKPENKCRQMVAVTEDYGSTWRQEPVPGSQACDLFYGQERVAVDQAGTLYVLWVDDTDWRLYMSTSRDKAHTWSKPVDVTAPGMTFSLVHANIAAAEPGHVLIGALETSVATRPTTPIGGLFGGAGYTSHAVLTESKDADRANPHFSSVDLDASGDPTLADGQSSTEANSFVALSTKGEAWAVFARHSLSILGTGQIGVAHLQPVDHHHRDGSDAGADDGPA